MSLVDGAGAPLTNAAHPALLLLENLVVVFTDFPLFSDIVVVDKTRLLLYVDNGTVLLLIPVDALMNPCAQVTS
jgi:1,6-anhydro-N-acetylmuramate kinase